jgi:hypothetical protein
MAWYECVSHFFAGLFLTNAVPHWVSGLMGHAFQTPFARLRGKRQSSSMLNVAWGAFNAAVGYVLLWHVGMFDVRDVGQVATVAVPSVTGSLLLARRFGRFNGGNDPR